MSCFSFSLQLAVLQNSSLAPLGRGLGRGADIHIWSGSEATGLLSLRAQRSNPVDCHENQRFSRSDRGKCFGLGSETTSLMSLRGGKCFGWLVISPRPLRIQLRKDDSRPMCHVILSPTSIQGRRIPKTFTPHKLRRCA